MICPRCNQRMSRPLRGRRTGLYIRTCLACGLQLVSSERPPDDPAVARVRVADVAQPARLDIRGRFARFMAPDTVRWVYGKQRQTGEDA